MKNKKILLYLTMSPQEGGKYQYTLSIIEALSKLDNKNIKIIAVFNSDIWDQILPDDIKDRYFIKENIVIQKIKVILFFIPLGIRLLRSIGKYIDPLQKLIYSLEPDIIFCPGGDKLCYEIKLPSIIPVFDLMHRYEITFPEVNSFITYWTKEIHYKNVCKYAKIILVDSETGKQQLIESYKVDAQKISILNYIAPSYVSLNISESGIKKRYNLPQNFIFYPAQFWHHKNHKCIIEALSILREKNILINAVFVGANKNGYSNINDLIKKHNLQDQIFILNYVSNEELVSLYKVANALVMPTFFGPTNIPPLEAFALGCPVIISNVYGIPDQVGEAALIFDPNNPLELSEKIIKVINNKTVRETLIKRGFEKYKSWNIIPYRNRLEEIINKSLLINNRHV